MRRLRLKRRGTSLKKLTKMTRTSLPWPPIIENRHGEQTKDAFHLSIKKHYSVVVGQNEENDEMAFIVHVKQVQRDDMDFNQKSQIPSPRGGKNEGGMGPQVTYSGWRCLGDE